VAPVTNFCDLMRRDYGEECADGWVWR